MSKGIWGVTPSSSSSSIWGSGKAPITPAKHGIRGFLSNLTHDIRNAAVGIPTGLVMLAEHPIRGLETMGKATWQDWSPLFHGHVGQWAHNVYDHPLAPILDVAGIMTGGGALIAKSSDALAALGVEGKLARLGVGGELAYDAPAARLAEAAERGTQLPPQMVKYTSNNPMVRIRQTLVHKLGVQLDAQLPSWYSRSVGQEGKYNRRLATQKIQRSNTLQGMQTVQLANHAQMETAYNAGKLIHDGDRTTWSNGAEYQAAKTSIFKFNHGNVARHAFRIADNGEKVAPDGFTFVRQAPGHATSEDFLRHLDETGNAATEADVGYYSASEGANFEEQLKHGLKPMITTHKVADAMRDERGNLLIVPEKDMGDLVKEAAGSAGLLKKLYLNPFRLWKRLQIGYSPKTVMNVSVGNMLMLMADQGGANMARGLYHLVREDRGAKFADNALRPYKMPVIEQHFGNVIHATMAQSLAEDTGIVGVSKTRLRKVAREGIYPLVHRSEQFTKRWQIHAELRGAPAVKKLMRQGHTFEDASQLALNADHHLVDRISQKVLHTGGDYLHLSGGEKLVRNIVPFYSWDKHMLSHAVQLLSDRAHVAAPLAAAGTMGSNEAEQQLGGHIPDFLKSALPLSMLGIHKDTGRIGVLQTTGLNPYSTGADIADLAQQLTAGGTLKPGEIIAGQMNPLITHGIEQISGHDINTDAAVHRHGGFFPSVFRATVEGLPETKLGKAALFPEPMPKPNSRTGETTPFLYRKDLETNVASWLGIPIKKVDLSSAEAQFKKQQDALAPHHKKKKTQFYFGGG